MLVTLAGGHLIIGDGNEIDDAAVTFEDGRIVSVGPWTGSTNAEIVIDLAGRTLMPGLIDLHTHMVGGDNAIGHGDEATTFKMMIR